MIRVDIEVIIDNYAKRDNNLKRNPADLFKHNYSYIQKVVSYVLFLVRQMSLNMKYDEKSVSRGIVPKSFEVQILFRIELPTLFPEYTTEEEEKS